MMFILYTLFSAFFIVFASLRTSAIPTAVKQMDTRSAGRNSHIAQFFDLRRVNPLCIPQCQAASAIVSTCDTDDCICKNKHDEAMSNCLHCADEFAFFSVEKEIAAYHIITFYLDVCSQPVDVPSSQNTTDTSGITVNNTSASAAPSPTQSISNTTVNGISATPPPAQSTIGVQSISGIESTSNSGSGTGVISTAPPLDTQVAASAQDDSLQNNGMTRSTVANALVVTVIMVFGTVLA